MSQHFGHCLILVSRGIAIAFCPFILAIPSRVGKNERCYSTSWNFHWITCPKPENSHCKLGPCFKVNKRLATRNCSREPRYYLVTCSFINCNKTCIEYACSVCQNLSINKKHSQIIQENVVLKSSVIVMTINLVVFLITLCHLCLHLANSLRIFFHKTIAVPHDFSSHIICLWRFPIGSLCRRGWKTINGI